MALIKFGGGVAGISGKIGGTVFARNKAGAFARNWAKPVNPGTVRQSQVRSTFGTQSAAWGGLDSAERDAWNGYASGLTRVNRMGETYVPSGRQVFIENANSLAQVGSPTRSTPDVSAVPPAAYANDIDTVSVTAGVLTTFDLQSTGVIANTSAIIEAAPIKPDTQTNVNVEYRQILVSASSAIAVDLVAAFTAVFGDVAAVGDIARLRVTMINTQTGLRSVPVLLTKIVA